MDIRGAPGTLRTPAGEAAVGLILAIVLAYRNGVIGWANVGSEYSSMMRSIISQQLRYKREGAAMIKDLLVHVDSTTAGQRRLAYAFDLAQHFSARLTGIHVEAPVDIPPLFKPSVVPRVAKTLEQRASEDAAKSAELFRKVASDAPVVTLWKALSGHMATNICAWGRSVDLIILGQYESEGSAERRPLSLAEEVVVEAGRAVLVVPANHDGAFRCRRVLVCWDASREAARAVHDALPLLRMPGTKAHLLSVDETAGPILLEEIIDHLRRHEVDVEIMPPAMSSTSELGRIIEQLEAGNFDLVVMGAFGHPVWQELLFGGVTEAVLARAKVPVLISH